MPYVPGDTVRGSFRTRNGSGVLTNADSTPTGTIYRNNTADGAVTVTVTNRATGVYSLSFAIPSGGSYVASDTVELELAASVGGVADKESFLWVLGSTSSSGATAAQVWDYLTSAITTSGSVGKLVKDNLDATVSSRSTLTSAQVNTEADTALADVGLTTTITGRIDAAISTRSSLDAAGVRTAAGLASANLDTQLAAIAGYIDTEVGAIKARTDNLPAAFPTNFADLAISATTGRVTVGSLATDAVNAASLAADAVTEIQSGLATAANVTAIKAVTDKLDTALVLDGSVYQFTANALELADGGGLDAAGVRAAIGLGSANLDTQIAALPSAFDMASMVFGSDIGIVDQLGGVLTFGQSQAVWFTALCGLLSGAGSGAGPFTIVFRTADDNAERISATTDQYGNRTAITITPPA